MILFNAISQQCLTCPNSLAKYKTTCVQECPQGLFETQEKECVGCSDMCSSTCSGPTKEDCDSIKPKYEIIIYILAIKTALWIGSSIAGYVMDLKTG